eukprot:4784789-Pleurochrysis_carterae.AAC.1
MPPQSIMNCDAAASIVALCGKALNHGMCCSWAGRLTALPSPFLSGSKTSMCRTKCHQSTSSTPSLWSTQSIHSRAGPSTSFSQCMARTQSSRDYGSTRTRPRTC